MNIFVKPMVVVSNCIEFEHCRYDGQIIRSEFVAKLKPFIEFITVCPEYEIGLGIPRDSIKIVEKNNKKMLIQPATGLNVTEKMNDFCEKFLENFQEIDGFILKSRSPSCGLKDVKIYPKSKQSAPKRRESGFFGQKVIEKYSNLAIEDEARLRNSSIKENFLKKIYTFARFREIKKNGEIKDLVDFHTKNKFLLMSYNQKNLREMGKILANQKNNSLDKIISVYEKLLFDTFSKGSRCNSNVNILQHAFGYISDSITKNEKEMFLNQLKKYKNKKIPLEIPLAVVKSWIIRFDIDYLKNQSYFEPYPSDLHEAEAVNICPSKDYWK